MIIFWGDSLETGWSCKSVDHNISYNTSLEAVSFSVFLCEAFRSLATGKPSVGVHNKNDVFLVWYQFGKTVTNSSNVAAEVRMRWVGTCWRQRQAHWRIASFGKVLNYPGVDGWLVPCTGNQDDSGFARHIRSGSGKIISGREKWIAGKKKSKNAKVVERCRDWIKLMLPCLRRSSFASSEIQRAERWYFPAQVFPDLLPTLKHGP